MERRVYVSFRMKKAGGLDVIDELAAAEGRSRSEMLRVLIGEALGRRNAEREARDARRPRVGKLGREA